MQRYFEARVYLCFLQKQFKQSSQHILSKDMPSLLLIEKTGVIKEISMNQFSESDLYKKAGFKTSDGFKCHTTWNVDIDDKKLSVSIYGKTDGRANTENKYDFPPPVDNSLFFGSCVLVSRDEDGEVSDLTEDIWDKVYEYLFGGFEDLGDEDSELSGDDSEYEAAPKTKTGYVKDNFVVDDDEEEDDEDDEEEDDEDDEDEPVIIIKKSKSKKSLTKKPSIPENIFSSISESPSDGYLDCGAELSEEEYFT